RFDCDWSSDVCSSDLFPQASDAQLNEARTYAYGGSHLADLGYFPLGSKLFSGLLHYVRSGDFVTELMKEADSPNDYAFALGAMADRKSTRLNSSHSQI